MGKIFLVDKHSKFYQTEILCLNQISAILLSYFKIKKKKLNTNDEKDLHNSICDAESYYSIQKI